MILVEPDYYEQFRCAASACPDTCCAAWEVVIDPEALAFYRGIPGAFGRRIRSAMHHTADGWIFRTENGRCPLLTDDRLCSVQLRYGQAHLCATCREYPKFVSEYGLLQERGVSLSCPEVCRMLLTRQTPVTFQRREDDTPLTGCNEIDADAFYLLKTARTLAMNAVQDRTQTPHRRLTRVLDFAEMLQRSLDADAPCDAEALFDGCGGFHDADLRCCPAAAVRTLKKWLHALRQLEILTPAWNASLDLLQTHLDAAERHPESWERDRRRFLTEQPPYRQEQLLVYYVYKFFLRSAYHRDVLCKARLIAFCVLMIEALNFAVWQKNGGTLTLAEEVENAHRFAREIEHSEENLDALTRRMQHSWNFSHARFANLLAD